MNTCRCHTRLLKVVMATLNESLLLIHSVDLMCMVNIEGDINHWNDWFGNHLMMSLQPKTEDTEWKPYRFPYSGYLFDAY